VIYRKTPPQPGRLLLRIVATSGAGTLLGVVACGFKASEGMGSSGAASGYEGMGATGSAVAGPMGSSGGVFGSTGSAYQSPVGITGSATDYGPMGSGTSPPMGSIAAPIDASPDALPDGAEAGGADATTPEAGQVVLGLVVAPPDAGADE
jgi:hypothetical protein